MGYERNYKADAAAALDNWRVRKGIEKDLKKFIGKPNEKSTYDEIIEAIKEKWFVDFRGMIQERTEKERERE
jgi:hypothetical protein